MHVLITGGTGFLGRHLIAALLTRGDRVSLLARDFVKAKTLFHNRVNLIGSISGAVADVDAVINLAGEPIADRRWTRKRKHHLTQSRIATTQALVQWLACSPSKPKVLISGSAIGYYGHYAEDITLDESASPRDSFASELCREWEAVALEAEALGVRTCVVRTGVVLDKHGGALKRMLVPFQLGLGGPIGSGRQWMSWIHREDMTRLLLFLIDNAAIRGPVNATAPAPVNNRTFARLLASSLHRPAILPLPAFALTILMGEAAELLLQGQQVVPKKLLQYGFHFQYPVLHSALAAIFSDAESCLAKA
ncbi:MAG: TIGR01777 family oxidoreductase [Cellvibrionaceae bacterium]|nr:TIGR01777 family oxidoreductase [Cellvibrionaceae bacterium]